ncbi:hypothetical protein K2Q02_01190 [Patescibacteria group bacterium]|nr:hypothetical protein [Patescibacteria group bacterium]
MIIIFSQDFFTQNTQQEKATMIFDEKTQSGGEISRFITDFVNTSVRIDDVGKMTALVECNIVTNTCAPGSDIEEPPYLSFVIMSLKDSGNSEHSKKADDLMEAVMGRCVEDVRYCDRNTFALFSYYQSTNDERYKEALLRLEDDLLKEKTPYVLVAQNIPAKWYLLYKVTEREEYKKNLLELADRFINNSFSEVIGMPEIYREADFVVYRSMPETVWSVMVPAYELSGDKKYLEYIKAFYKNAKIENHIVDIWNAPGGASDVIKSVEALIQLSVLDSESAGEHRALARTLLETVLRYYWDTPDRVIVNGDFGVFTENMGKRINLQGWLAVLMEDLKEESFSVYTKNQVTQ